MTGYKDCQNETS